jgi:hypothetical protein
VIEAGLLRQFCGLTLQEIAGFVGVSRSGAWLRCAAHDEWLGTEKGYAERVERVVLAVQAGEQAANSGKP